MVGCQNDGPFLDPYYNHNFDNHPYNPKIIPRIPGLGSSGCPSSSCVFFQALRDGWDGLV